MHRISGKLDLPHIRYPANLLSGTFLFARSSRSLRHIQYILHFYKLLLVAKRRKTNFPKITETFTKFNILLNAMLIL